MIARSILAFALAAWFGGAPSDVREVQITPAGAETEGRRLFRSALG